MSERQTYATHRRNDPLYHWFVVPVSALWTLAAGYFLVRKPDLHHAFLLVAAIATVLLVLKVRLYALRVQDRVIRLEETLRMQRLLPADLQGRVHELSPRQMVGLRFASDAELADRVREALDERLDGEAIKKRIQSWKPDTFRV
jgi:hypothetical protein